MSVLTEAKADLARSTAAHIPPNQGLKNFTAFELTRYIDKQLTGVARAQRNHRSGSADQVGQEDQQGKVA